MSCEAVAAMAHAPRRGRADRLDGGADDDTVSYYTGSIGVTGGSSAGTASGGDAQGDALIAIENVSGSQGTVQITGTTGVSILQGWNGDDLLRGGAGGDLLDGGAGIDTASYYTSSIGITAELSSFSSDGDSLVSIENLSGSQHGGWLTAPPGTQRPATLEQLMDVLPRRGRGRSPRRRGRQRYRTSYDTGRAEVTVDLSAGTAGSDDAKGGHLISIENVTGSRGDDRLTGNAGDQLAWKGGEGNDLLRGGARHRPHPRRRLRHRCRQPTTSPPASRSIWAPIPPATAKPKGDVLISVGNLTGGQGNDTLAGNAGASVLPGLGRQRHAPRLGRGRRRLGGGAGADMAGYYGGGVGVSGRAWRPVLSAAATPGRCPGLDRERLRQPGRRHPRSAAPAPALQELGQQRPARGGAGKDTLTGRRRRRPVRLHRFRRRKCGRRQCRPHHRFQPGAGRPNRPVGDRRQCRRRPGDQGFSFIGSGLLHPPCRRSCAFSVTGSSVTTISGDVNGDGVADFRIQLTGAVALQASTSPCNRSLPGAGASAPGRGFHRGSTS